MLLPPVTTGKQEPQESPGLTDPLILSNCTLPTCFCSSDGTLIPGGMLPTDVPQVSARSSDL